MGVRDLNSGSFTVLGTAKASINSTTTANFSFDGADLDLSSLLADGDYDHNDRVLVVLKGTTTGTTDTLSWSIQDAKDDGAGSISSGTLATALTSGTLTGGTGDQTAVVAVKPQYQRPWLRVRHSSTGATDTFAVTATVLAVPNSLV